MGPNRLKAIVISAVMAALALTLPVAFHAVGMGSRFLPMLLPLLLNGFLVPFPWAVGVAFLVPWISALATGMPPLYPPVAAVVSAEGVALAGVASLLYRRGRKNVWSALIPAVIAGRCTALLAMWILAKAFALPPALSAVASVLEGLPGVVLQLAVVPPVLHALSKRRSLLLDDGG